MLIINRLLTLILWYEGILHYFIFWYIIITLIYIYIFIYIYIYMIWYDIYIYPYFPTNLPLLSSGSPFWLAQATSVFGLTMTIIPCLATRGWGKSCARGNVNQQRKGTLPSGKQSHSYGKSPSFMGKSSISMAIFNSYVKLPEGIYTFYIWYVDVCIYIYIL